MKPQLLIIPGWEGTTTSWQNFISLAKNDFDVYCFDLPCFGAEPCPNAVWGVEEYANFILEKIQVNNLNKPILLGHSFGGQIAAYLAAKQPDKLSKLVLSGAAVIRQTPSLKKIIFNSLAKTGKIIFSLPLLNQASGFMKKVLYRAANSDYNRTEGIKREIYKKITAENLSQLAKTINLPTLLIWGENDTYVPLNQGKKINQLINSSKLEIIKDAKHGLHLKQTAYFYNLIKAFALK